MDPRLRGGDEEKRFYHNCFPSLNLIQYAVSKTIFYRVIMNQNTYGAKASLSVNGTSYDYYSLPKASEKLGDIASLPFSLKILLENLLRFEDNKTVSAADIEAFVTWIADKKSNREIAYRPARVLMQDFTGVPAVVDLAAMRDAMNALGQSPEKINPLVPVHLVIDHSVQVDTFGNASALTKNTAIEMERNYERYEFLRWGQDAFDNFAVVPPGTGICHQVNLEYLAKCVWTNDIEGKTVAYPDTLVGTDSHTTMINGLGILGWGVGGIEAEAAMLGQPISMLIPEVVGFELKGKLREGMTATDLVLTITQMLRKHGVVDKFVEFYGEGLADLPVTDRATIANMAPEYGATCGFFPIDAATIDYLRLSGRDESTIALVETYCKAQGLWHDKNTPAPIFSSSLSLDLATVEASLAGPKRPQDRVVLSKVPEAFIDASKGISQKKSVETSAGYEVSQGDVVIAAITSCTNTSNPNVMIAAGLLAKKALEKGLNVRPFVKTSLAPGSMVVTEYLTKTGLLEPLAKLGFSVVGYGCTTCIGNSGPLPEPVAAAITEGDLTVCAVLSGNRNFEGRVHPQVKANWLASPPLVVAYALAGNIKKDLTSEPLGKGSDGDPVYLKDVWPSNQEIAEAVSMINGSMYKKEYANVFNGNETWNAIPVKPSETYSWNRKSTYVRLPPFFEGLKLKPEAKKDVIGACVLAIFGDSITTDHISPAGDIKADSPAGRYLLEQGVSKKDFNSYGARRGNHEVMMRGTFANIRIKNEMLDGVEGGFSRHYGENKTSPIYDVAMQYQAENRPLVIFAGKEYGTGSSRDWAAKGTLLLGVKAVVAESFERIHRSNLIGMGVLPLQFPEGMTRKTLELVGDEIIDIMGISGKITPKMSLKTIIYYANGEQKEVQLRCRIDTQNEVEYYLNDGILQYVLRNMIGQK
jgi:aconitate hydratase